MSIVQIPVLIANGTALSAEIDIGVRLLEGIAMPAAWTAAALTFQTSIDGGTTWLEMQGASAVLTYSAAQGQFIAVDAALWRGVNMIKVRSGISGTPVNQAADRTLTLVLS